MTRRSACMQEAPGLLEEIYINRAIRQCVEGTVVSTLTRLGKLELMVRESRGGLTKEVIFVS